MAGGGGVKAGGFYLVGTWYLVLGSRVDSRQALDKAFSDQVVEVEEAAVVAHWSQDD